jgi:hypothetical protein
MMEKVANTAEKDTYSSKSPISGTFGKLSLSLLPNAQKVGAVAAVRSCLSYAVQEQVAVCMV